MTQTLTDTMVYCTKNYACLQASNMGNILLLLLTSTLLRGINAFIAYDCAGSVANVTTVSMVDVADCAIRGPPPITTRVEIQLIQKSNLTPLKVIQCLVVTKTLIYHCGWQSYNSIVNGGIRTYVKEINKDECERMHAYKEYRVTPRTIMRNLRVNGTTLATVTLAGKIRSDGGCQPEEFHDGTRSWGEVIVIGEMSIQLAQYRADYDLDTNKVILRSGQVCAYTSGYCIDQIGGMTYWNLLDIGECSGLSYDVLFQGYVTKVQDVYKHRNRTTYIAEEGKVVFALEGRQPLLLCGQKGYQTEHPKMIVIESNGLNFVYKPKRIDVTKLDIFLYINSKFVYVERHTGAQMNELYYHMKRQKCLVEKDLLRAKLSAGMNDPISFAYDYTQTPGYTGIRLGEVIHIIQCQPVNVTLKGSDKCFDELPVTYNDRTFYMTPRNHLLKTHGTEIDCTPFLEDEYKINGVWIASGKKITRTIEPLTLSPSHDEEWKYEDISQLLNAGIYTEEQLTELRRHIMYPAERPSVENIIVRGVLGLSPDRQNTEISKYFTPNDLKEIANSITKRAWGIFSSIGVTINGLVGIYAVSLIIKYVFSTLIHGYELYKVFGISFKLIAALWGTLANLFKRQGDRTVHTTRKTIPQNKTPQVTIVKAIAPEENTQHTTI